MFAAACAVALGCSGDNFEIADQSDAATDTNVVADTSVATDSNIPLPDTNVADLGSDTNPIGMDAGPADSTTTNKCARTGDCPANHYCKYSGCGATLGVCTPLSPLPGPYYNPVCGCDGITYWNKEHAYTNSVAIAHEDPCTLAERKTCTTPGATCGGTPDSICVGQLGEASGCAISAPVFGCWRWPTGTLCGTAGGPPMMSCTDGECLSQCAAIKKKTVKFYPASCTPPG